MRYLLLPLLLLIFTHARSQDTIIWRPDYQLKLSDFASPSTEVDSSLTSFSLNSAVNIEFSYFMPRAQFAFTKNFNSDVQAVFNRSASVLVAPNQQYAHQLLDFAQYQFDLSELYARKFRKALHDQKHFFTKGDFYKAIYDKLLAEENDANARVGKESNYGENQAVLKTEHEKVLQELKTLSDYCRTCPPPKKVK